MISAIKIKGSFPTSDNLFSNDDYLTILNMQMKLDIQPLLLTLSEEFFLMSKDFTIAPNITYRIPSRAIGAKIRDLQYIDGSNNVTHIPRIFEEDRDSNPRGYYVIRNSVELSNDMTSNTLRMKYFGRPNALVLPVSCGQVTSIDSAVQVTVSSLPTTIVTSALCDFVQNNNPYDLLDYDLSVVGVSGTSVTFTSLPTGLAVGDWLCLAQQSPVPMIPDELHPVLIQSALVSALSSKKDKAVQYESGVLAQYKLDAIKMLDPRVENDSIKFRSGRLLSYISQIGYY